MTPESQIIARAQHEFNAGALAQRYDLIRQQLAFQGGQIVVGSEARSQFATEQREQQEIQKQRSYEEKNAKFIARSVLMLPWIHEPIANKPQNYLAVQGLMDRVVWVKHNKYNQTSPQYVVGANPKRGLVTHGRGNFDIEVHTTRKARKLAGHFSNILHNPDPALLEEVYRPETDSFLVRERHSMTKTLKLGSHEAYSDHFPDAYLHEYGVVSHLMHLASIFNVQHEWGNLLKTHTGKAPKGEVSQLKGIFEAHFGKQPELPSLQTKD